MGKNKEYELAIKIAGEIEKSFYESTKLTKKELRDIAKQSSQAAMAAESMNGMSLAKLNRSLQQTAPIFNQLEHMSESAFNAMKKGAAMSAAAISAISATSIAVGSDFEEQMSTVQAISMSADSDMARLNDKAKELGKSTKFSATEVGQGFEYMAMAGWKTEDMLDGINGVLNLAAASGEDLGEVSDIVTDAMTAFGLGAEQAGHFADILAIASSNSNTNVSMMGETFKYVAPVAGALGYKIEDTAVAIGLMANSGIKASQAGTSLRSMLSRLAAPTKEVKGAMDALNLSMTDEDGNVKSFLKLTQDIRAGFSGMSEVQQSEIASKLAGQEAMSGLLAIANASDEDFNKLTEAINDSTGAAEKMAEIRLDNLKGDITILRSATEGFGIELYENFNEPLRDIVQTGTEFIGSMANEINAKYPTARRKVMDFADSMKELQEPLLKVGGWFLDNPGAITGPVIGLGTALAGYEIASGISSITKALGALNPAGMAILGIGGVVGVITGIGTAVKKAAAEAKKANLAAHFGDISLSMAELQETAAFVVQSQSLDEVRKSMEAMGELDGIAQDIRIATEELSKKNWMVSIGMELSADEQEEYQHYIDNYIQSMQDYAVQNQYAITLSVQALLGEDLKNSNVVDKLNGFYSNKQQELREVGEKLSKAVSDAFLDDFLDIPEAKEIAEFQQQMADIQAAMTNTNFESGLDLLGMKYGNTGLDTDSFINLQAEINEQTKQAMADYDEAYISAMSSYRQMLADGGWSQEEYDSAVADLNAGYLQQQSDIQVKAAQFQVDIIKQNYGEEWEPLIRQMQEETSGQLGDMLQHVAYEGGPNVHFDLLDEGILDAIEIDSATRDAMAELYKLASPLMFELQETEEKYRKAGKEIPEAVREGLADISALGALGGDTNAMWELIGETAESPEYQAAISSIKEAGTYLPEEIANAIRDNQSVVNEAVKQSALDTKNAYLVEYQKAFEGGTGFNVRVNFITEAVRQGTEMLPSGLPGHKDGGIFDSPHLAWVAEAGYPESIIPLNGSKEAIDLWLKTGELLGMDGLTGGKEPLIDDIAELAYSGGGEMTIHIEHNPTLQFYGGTPSKEDIEDALMSDEEEFDRKMQDWMARNRRLKFSSMWN